MAGAIFGTPSKAKSEPKDMQAAEFSALRSPFADILAAMLQGGPGQFNASPQATGIDPNAVTAPISFAEKNALADVNALTMDPTRRGLLQDTMAGKFLPGQEGANPFTAAMIELAQRPTMEALQHAVGRQIPSMFARGGQTFGQTIGSGSTAKDLNVIRASEIGARALGDIATGISFQVGEAERGRMQQAVALSQEEGQRAIANLGAQALPRLIQDLGIERSIQIGAQTQTQWLQLMAMLGGITAPALANSSTATGASKGIFEQLFPKGIFSPSPSNIGVTS